MSELIPEFFERFMLYDAERRLRDRNRLRRQRQIDQTVRAEGNRLGLKILTSHQKISEIFGVDRVFDKDEIERTMQKALAEGNAMFFLLAKYVGSVTKFKVVSIDDYELMRNACCGVVIVDAKVWQETFPDTELDKFFMLEKLCSMFEKIICSTK